MVTIFKDIWSKEPNYITIEQALARIKNGKSKDKVQMVRDCIDKERANELKKHLPSVCFSGKFGNNRTDSDLIEHSGFLVLDFDNCDVQEKKKDLIKNSFVHSCWVSPGGNGVKALVKISEPSKHKEHFKALQEIYPEVDKSGINPSRVCYESFDLDIYFNLEPTTFDKFFVDKKSPNIKIGVSEDETFQKILKWLSNKGDAFRTGERNIFVFKLASACCRFGVDEIASISQIKSILSTDNTFSVSEIERTVKSAYKSNMAVFGYAKFENEKLTLDYKDS